MDTRFSYISLLLEVHGAEIGADLHRAAHRFGTDPPAVACRYASDRRAERTIEHLAGFSGVLQVDGMAAMLPLSHTTARA